MKSKSRNKKPKRRKKVESTINELEVNGKKYVLKGSQEEIKGYIKIVILQRGWIMVGKFERSGNDCKLHNASVIRNWGTTNGLGEIAKDGPKSATKLDKCNGLVEFDYLTVCAMISCEESRWKNVL